jgi:LPXTG-site transpeptidase (sortase) family protein
MAKAPKSAELANVRVPFNFKKHLLPPLGGLGVTILLFGFFNSQYLSGRIAYALKDHSTSVVTAAPPSATAQALPDYTIDANAPPVITIPKISVNAPVVYSEQTINEKSFQRALQHGVVHYPQTALPGEAGNVVLFGHSSGQWWAPGDYKFVFSLLDKLAVDDVLNIDYQGTRYTYKVTSTHVVLPDDVRVLTQDSNNYTLTLLTCTPVGTNAKRLVIEAKQINPIPFNRHSTDNVPQTTPTEAKAQLPSSAPSVWQSFTGLFK